MEAVLPLSALPVPDPGYEARAAALLGEACRGDRLQIVALDDDPTGVQTVSGVSVYTDWTMESLREGFAEKNGLFFLLTNSRAMSARRTEELHREIARRVCEVAREAGRPFLIVNRGDSTLRGHYPLETETVRREIERATGKPVDGEILFPYFKEGGRYTLGDVHYVRAGDALVPAAQTEFAKDATFGYRHSNLREYIEEKSGCPAAQVRSVPLERLRALDVDGVARMLGEARDYQRFVVNATDDGDAMVFAAALRHALQAGKTFCCRTAASFVKAMGNVPSRPLLTREELLIASDGAGGLVLVGSHTQKTTAQLRALLTLPGTVGLEMDTDLVLEPGALEAEARRVTERCDGLIAGGQTPVVYTKRAELRLPDDTPEGALARSVRISRALQSVAADLRRAPAFIIAKGGITSSDIGVQALRVRRALVLGQLCPGVPVWRTGPESRFPGVPYVIFPGNVGQDDTLKQAAALLLGEN